MADDGPCARERRSPYAVHVGQLNAVGIGQTLVALVEVEEVTQAILDDLGVEPETARAAMPERHAGSERRLDLGVPILRSPPRRACAALGAEDVQEGFRAGCKRIGHRAAQASCLQQTRQGSNGTCGSSDGEAPPSARAEEPPAAGGA